SSVLVVLSLHDALPIYFIFWVFIVWVDRLLFLLFASPESISLSLEDILRIFWNGFQMDLSAASYICALPFLGYFIWSFIPKMRLDRKSTRLNSSHVKMS